MSEEFKDENVMAVLQKIQERLVYLEKKIDTLITNQSQARPSFNNKERTFSKPYRSFTPSAHFNKGPREHRSDYKSGPRSEGRPDSRSRGKDFKQDRPFEKRSSDDSRRYSSPKKKEFYHKRNDR